MAVLTDDAQAVLVAILNASQGEPTDEDLALADWPQARQDAAIEELQREGMIKARELQS